MNNILPDDFPSDDAIAIEQLEAVLQARFAGRVHGLKVVQDRDGVILLGLAASFYVKQLIQHEVQVTFSLPLAANEIQVIDRNPSPEP